ncbi:TetR/AcrR family transcriptional regulator [Ruania halotolerans]|uniref:TetR/AcrR family transcriptional regulator n=1 Tax=Ruania halotolerans TaxID=2897773 RepID=UPI001E2E8975|nr:TetR/AcrR family transcriptional regulator [Ruania halotolerans]UFU05269.1 TetR/AcrR family transcriptional regulator [Ruania halotolerans]
MTLPDSPAEIGLRERKRAETRARFARAAFDLARTRGVDGFTIDELADAVGVARRTFFNHFTSKEEAVSHIVAMKVHEALASLAHPGATLGLDDCRVIESFGRTGLLGTIAQVTRALLAPDVITLFRQFGELTFTHPTLIPLARQVEEEARQRAAEVLRSPEFGALDPLAARLVPGVVVSTVAAVIQREIAVTELDGPIEGAMTIDELVEQILTFLTQGIGTTGVRSHPDHPTA